MNPALLEMMARDRSAELRAAAADRSLRSAGTAARPASSRSGPHVHLANPQRAIGWFLVSVGLRLVLPRTPAGPAR